MDVWRHKLGLIVPSWNTVMEYEIQRMAGGAFSVHTMRIAHTADTEENLLWLATQATDAARLLAHARVNVICYGCTASGFLKGPHKDREIGAEIEAVTGIAAATTSGSVVEALRALGARRVSVATAYEPWLNERVRSYLEAAGFAVAEIRGFGTQAHAAITPERVAALAAEVDRPEAEALFVSCSNLRTLEIIEPVERSIGKPVVTSNQASLWKMLRLIGDRRDIPGAGRLLREA
ncbi:MAG TPA: decarboxylase [Burkholderiales bacterium]|nr:decarboxylase [Burkholderiales bacterium]